MKTKIKNKNALFGKVPSCDHCNNALRYIIDGNYDDAFSEIVYAIVKANGYYHTDIVKVAQDRLIFTYD